MTKIKFTSKKGTKPSKLQRAGGEQICSLIYCNGETVMSVTGYSSLCLYCAPTNVCLNLKGTTTHREAINWVKEHAQELWEKYPFKLKLKEEYGKEAEKSVASR